MAITQIRSSPIDKLWILWAICLIKHYQENGKLTSPINIIDEFGDRNWKLFRTACEMADHYRLLDYSRMRLTQKGLDACDQWQTISKKIFSL
jgi:hypothetical protein